MPRRRPSQVRACDPSRLRGRPRTPTSNLPHASSALTAAIARLEHERLWPGAIADALRWWSLVARRPSRALSGGCGCESCLPVHRTEERATLELALHALPARPARELRRLVEPLDGLYRAGSHPDPLASGE